MKKEWQRNIIFILGLVLVGYLMCFLDKNKLVNFIQATMPADEAGLFLGIFLGDKSVLTRNWYEIFEKVGVLHIVVASGANLAILAKIVIDGLAGMIGRKRAIILGMCLVGIYVKIIGFEAPIGRALILFVIYYWGQFLGRKFNMVTALILMFFVLLIVDIDIFTGVSFWLSLVAFLAVFSFSKIKIKSKKYKWLNLFLLNIWISLWIWPITSMVFGEINILSIFVNPLLFLGVEFIFCLGVLVVGVYLFVPFLATGVMLLGLPFLKYFLEICKLFYKLGIEGVDFKINIWILIGCYLVLGWLLMIRANHDSLVHKK